MKTILPFLFFLLLSAQAEPLFDSYHDNKELDLFIQNLNSPNLTKKILSETKGKNKIHCLQLSSSKKIKPTILILGDTNPASPVGTEIILQWLSTVLQNKDSLQELLKENSIYIIPRPFPDSIDTFFKGPRYENRLNKTQVDSDSDLIIDEDNYEDLNKDGFITSMRLKDEEGTFYQNSESEFLMTKEKNKKSPAYKVFSEGIDNDKDERFNEDRKGGVNPNRNFSFAYPYFQKDAGLHQFSEIESKTIADFAFSHPEIFLVFSFGDEDNLTKPWKEDSSKKNQAIRETIYKEDDAQYATYSKTYNKHFDVKTKKSSKANTHGSFTRWAYYHFGRISLTATPWSIPIETVEGKMADKIKEIKWLAKHRPQALIKWQKFKHPDFPNKQLEIGGVKPFYSYVPDIDTCKKKSLKLHSFLKEALELKAKLSIKEFKEEKLNEQLSRITLKVKNIGKSPTRPEIGGKSKKMYPINIHIKLPNNWEIYKGNLRNQISRIKANTTETLEWLILSNGRPGQAEITITSPHLNTIRAKLGEAQ